VDSHAEVAEAMEGLSRPHHRTHSRGTGYGPVDTCICWDGRHDTLTACSVAPGKGVEPKADRVGIAHWRTLFVDGEKY
jgi:hypothetical protein